MTFFFKTQVKAVMFMNETEFFVQILDSIVIFKWIKPFENNFTLGLAFKNSYSFCEETVMIETILSGFCNSQNKRAY